jgi:hypothetical protein
MTISLVNVVKYYKGEPNQEKALKILQAELERTNPELLKEDAEFVKIWKSPEEEKSGNAIVATSTAVVTTADSEANAAIGRRNATNGGAIAVTTTSTIVKTSGSPANVLLPVPYFTQLDNTQNPHGSCNVTSVAMCLSYFGHQSLSPTGEQLEDELYRYCSDNGLSRHSPTDLAKLVEIYGYKDDFQPDAKWGDVKAWLAAGKPCIAHGWFTRSGHIVTIVGYNEKGWIINDPYGEWFDWGYDTSVSGKGLIYTYGMMKQICGSDGDLWIHFMSK